MNKQKFLNFVNYTGGVKEISLILANDEEELKEYESELIKNNFSKIFDLAGLSKAVATRGRFYFFLKSSDSDLKNIYDLSVQYPTGQVEIFNTVDYKMEVINPNYDKLAIVFIVLKTEAEKINFQYNNFFNVLGLTYQE